MKITEETKIKEIVPENYAPLKAHYSVEDAEIAGYNGEIISIIIHCKRKEKSFEDYVEIYGKQNISLFKNTGEVHLWNMKNKLGLLWYITRDKKGDLYDLSDLISILSDPTPDYRDTSTEISEEVLMLLPEKFINSFKTEQKK